MGRRRGRHRGRILIGLVALLALAGLGIALLTTYTDQQRLYSKQKWLEAPAGLSADALSPSSVELRWKPAKNAEGYNVVIASDRAFTRPKVTRVPAERTQVAVDDLATATPGIDQFYRVDAIKDGQVQSSRTSRFTLKPGEVRKLRVPDVTASGFRATWRKAANARQFEVTLARDKSFTRQASTVRTLSVDGSFVSKGLKPSTKYWLKVRPVNGAQVGEFTKPVSFSTTPRESAFKVGTWNVCSEKCNGYEGRAQIMGSLIDANKLDMFALQEAGGQRVGPVTARIFSGRSQGYRLATGGARARYIFYRPQLFEQLAGGSFGIGDGRDTTWAKFKLKETGRTFYYVSVHLENGKGKGDDAKRARETDRMLAQLAQINAAGDPIIYAGDFNSGTHRSADSPGAKMRASGFGNTFLLTKDITNGDISTSHTFSTQVLRAGAHVDHIWVSKQFDLESWEQLVRLNGARYASPVVSDHNLLAATVALNVKQKKLGKPTPTTGLGTPPL